MDALARFVDAQDGIYARTLKEIRAGDKRSHWMWFIFPQLAGLGRSAMAQRFAIADINEAQAYAAHALLGPRLIECAQAMLDWAGKRSAWQILGHVDAMKFRSSMTLFEIASPAMPCFAQALDAFHDAQRCALTLSLLESSR